MGVAVFEHPEISLLGEPRLVAFLDRWRTGARRRVKAKDYDRLPSFEVELLLIAQAAHRREEGREIERLRKKGASGDDDSSG